MRIALAQNNQIIGDLEYNLKKIVDTIEKAKLNHVELLVFPELHLCGYPPQDLLLLPSFIQELDRGLMKIIPKTRGITIVLGTVRVNPSIGEKRLLNTAAIISEGELIGFQDKILLPDYDVFSEKRYFEAGNQTDLWSIGNKRVAITICEDLWQHANQVEYSQYPRDPVLEFKEKKPDFLINLSASPYYAQREETRFFVCSKTAKTLCCPVYLCNQVGANDSLIFDGRSLAVNEKGELIGQGKAFDEDLVLFETDRDYAPFFSKHEIVEDLFHALVLGIKDYFYKLGFKKACLGISGGIDSAVVSCLAQEALGSENVLGILLPSRYTSNESKKDAEALLTNLGIAWKEIPIEGPFQSFLDILQPHFDDLPPNHAEENLQSRIRGTILMALSNKFGYLVLSTGNKSEMAMGYMTLYGDMCGGLAVLADVSKEWVYRLAHFMNREQKIIPLHILKKAPTAELRLNQKDTDVLPDYSIVDQVLKEYVEEHRSPEEIAERNNWPIDFVKDLVRRIHVNEYKRRQAPPGLRVTRKAFSIGRRFPIVQRWNI
jgi:NAD+ synthase (glutamine-hydrolysing)